MSGGHDGGLSVPSHVVLHLYFCAVIVTGMEKVAPSQPADEFLSMETAPARSTETVLLAWIVLVRPVWEVNVTPVVVQPG